MICKQCGENLPDNARVCDTCGARVVRSVAVTAEGPTVYSEPKVSKTAGEFFKEVFSSKDFFTIAVLFTVLAVLTAAVYVFSAFSEVLAQNGMDLGISEIMNMAVQICLVVLVWKLNRKAVAVTEPKGHDFRKLLTWCRYYTVLHLGVTVVSAVIDLIIVAVVSGLTLSVLGSAILSTVISILPVYAAYKLACSLETSAVNDRVLLDGIGTLNIFMIIMMIAYLLCTVMSLVLCLIHWIFIPVVLMIALNAFLVIRIRDWLQTLKQKSEYPYI